VNWARNGITRDRLFKRNSTTVRIDEDGAVTELIWSSSVRKLACSRARTIFTPWTDQTIGYTRRLDAGLKRLEIRTFRTTECSGNGNYTGEFSNTNTTRYTARTGSKWTYLAINRAWNQWARLVLSLLGATTNSGISRQEFSGSVAHNVSTGHTARIALTPATIVTPDTRCFTFLDKARNPISKDRAKATSTSGLYGDITGS
jgi:hypothetical protein